MRKLKLDSSAHPGWIILAGLVLAMLMAVTVQCDKKENSTADDELDRKVQAIQNEYSNVSICGMCGKEASGKTVCNIYISVGEKVKTCCARCGVLMFKRLNRNKGGSTVCYATGQPINGLKKAYYVVNSDVKTCCSPSVLAFCSLEEAEKFVETHHGEIKRFKDI